MPQIGTPENRVILLTPPGGAAIAVLRLTGPRVAGFLRDHFSKPVGAGKCVHGELADGPRAIDDPVVVLLADGSAADVCLHGGPWVVRAAIEMAEREGFRAVAHGAGELPAEAVDGEGELQREILVHLPLARTEAGLRMLLAQEAAWDEWLPRVGQMVRETRRAEAVAVLSDPTLRRMLHPARVAIVGPANVGKSTLANQLFGQARSITADVPGTTRDWVGEMADVNGLPVMLVDTPGVRDTPDPIERAALDRAAGVVAATDLVVLVWDASQSCHAAGQSRGHSSPNAIRVLNKSDLAHGPAGAAHSVIRTVGTTGEGLDDLRHAIVRGLGCDVTERGRPRWWTSRQRALLEAFANDEARPR